METAATVLHWLIDRARREDRGASLVEYALLVGLIAVVCVGAMSFFGGSLTGMFDTIGNSL